MQRSGLMTALSADAIRSPDSSLATVVDIGANLTKWSRADVLVVVRRAAEAGVSAIIITGTSLSVSRQAYALAKWVRAQSVSADLPRLYFTAGVHPHDAAKAPTGFVRALRELAESPLCVAIGEAGL